MTKQELQKRVDERKQQIKVDSDKLQQLKKCISDFISDIKGRSTIYRLIKSFPVWQKLEEMAGDNNAD